MDKTMMLTDAVQRYIDDGCQLFIGGFTMNRNPMAAVYEIIRQGKKNLHLYAHSNGQGVDELVGLDSVKGVMGQLDSDFSVYPDVGLTVPSGDITYRLRRADQTCLWVRETSEAIRDWVTHVRSTHYILGSTVGFLS